jgi:hypothetical protein
MARSKEDILDSAEFDDQGKLSRLTFDWLRKGNRKFSSWKNTILGNLTISGDSLVAVVNSKKRAARIRAEIEKRLGAMATHENTIAQSPEEMLESSETKNAAQPKFDEVFHEEILRDPEFRKRAEASLQKLIQDWVRQEIPVLGNLTPLQAVRDPEGKEIVESLLLEWERRVEDGHYSSDVQPDFPAIRKLLDLEPPASG